MSFFGRDRGQPQPPPPQAYSRVQGDPGYSLPAGPRAGMRQPGPPSAQYHPPAQPYNDPSNALFEKRGADRGYSRSPAPRSGGGGGGYRGCVTPYFHWPAVDDHAAQLCRCRRSKRGASPHKLLDRTSIRIPATLTRPGKRAVRLDGQVGLHVPRVLPRIHRRSI